PAVETIVKELIDKAVVVAGLEVEGYAIAVGSSFCERRQGRKFRGVAAIGAKHGEAGQAHCYRKGVFCVVEASYPEIQGMDRDVPIRTDGCWKPGAGGGLF